VLLRSQSDARLVELTRDGNERAFEAIVQRYRAPLLRYCSRLLPPTRAEDAVQQAFLSAHRAIQAGDAELNLRPWLYRIAHNASLNLLRQNGFDHDQVSEEIDGVETPPQAFERSERLRTVVADAIVLRALEGRSYEEIATELGVTDGAVRQLLNRARNTLREAAAALTPTGLLTRLAASGAEAPVAERIAAVVVGGGGGALLAKATATLVVAGAVTGGAVTGTLPGTGDRQGREAGVATAAAPREAGTAAGDPANGALIAAGPDRSELRTRVRHLSGNSGPGGNRGGSGGGERGGASGRSGERGSEGHEQSDDHEGRSEPEEDERDGGRHSSGSDDEPRSDEDDSSGPGPGGSREPDEDDIPEPDDDPIETMTDPLTDNSGPGSSGKAGEPEEDEPPEDSGHSGPG
jgi:RNA polymerase sigma factor (sigma-70 family)